MKTIVSRLSTSHRTHPDVRRTFDVQFARPHKAYDFDSYVRVRASVQAFLLETGNGHLLVFGGGWAGRMAPVTSPPVRLRFETVIQEISLGSNTYAAIDERGDVYVGSDVSLFPKDWLKSVCVHSHAKIFSSFQREYDCCPPFQIPRKLTLPPILSSVKQVSLGAQFVLFLLNDGSVYVSGKFTTLDVAPRADTVDVTLRRLYFSQNEEETDVAQEPQPQCERVWAASSRAYFQAHTPERRLFHSPHKRLERRRQTSGVHSESFLLARPFELPGIADTDVSVRKIDSKGQQVVIHLDDQRAFYVLNDKVGEFHTPTGSAIVDVACGWKHTLLLDENHQIYSQGSNDYGESYGLEWSEFREEIDEANERVLDNLLADGRVASADAHVCENMYERHKSVECGERVFYFTRVLWRRIMCTTRQPLTEEDFLAHPIAVESAAMCSAVLLSHGKVLLFGSRKGISEPQVTWNGGTHEPNQKRVSVVRPILIDSCASVGGARANLASLSSETISSLCRCCVACVETWHTSCVASTYECTVAWDVSVGVCVAPCAACE